MIDKDSSRPFTGDTLPNFLDINEAITFARKHAFCFQQICSTCGACELRETLWRLAHRGESGLTQPDFHQRVYHFSSTEGMALVKVLCALQPQPDYIPQVGFAIMCVEDAIGRPLSPGLDQAKETQANSDASLIHYFDDSPAGDVRRLMVAHSRMLKLKSFEAEKEYHDQRRSMWQRYCEDIFGVSVGRRDSIYRLMPNPLGQRQVLWAYDRPDWIHYEVEALHELGFGCHVILSREKAEDALRSRRYDLVIADLEWGDGGSGLEIERVALDPAIRVPVVFYVTHHNAPRTGRGSPIVSTPCGLVSAINNVFKG